MNRKYDKKHIIVLLFTFFVIFFGIYASRSDKVIEKKLLASIKNNLFNEEKINKNLLDKVCANIEKHQKDGENLTAEQYYYLSYKDMLEDNEQDYKKNILSSYYCINEYTNAYVRLNVNLTIAENFNEDVSTEDQINSFKDSILSLSFNELNANWYTLEHYISIMSLIIEDRDIFIDVLDDIHSESFNLASDLSYFIMDTLSMEYFAKGNYAKSIELILKILWNNEINSSPYYEARALVNKALIYSELNDYNTAIEYLKESLDVKIEDEYYDIDAKLYAVINLGMIYYEIDDYDSMRYYLEWAKKYMTNRYEGIFNAYNHMAYAKYFLKINNLEEAEKHINLTNELYINEDEVYNDLHIHHSLNLGELNYRKGNIDDAIHIYTDLLKTCANKYSAKKKILQNLIDIYEKNGDYDNSVKYLNMLKDVYSEESLMINDSYSNNLMEIRQYEKEVAQIENNKHRYTLIFVSIVMLTLIISLYYYFNSVKLKKVNRIDGLTKIYNRKYFNEVFEKILIQQQNFNIIIFDIDNFKYINDTYGHVFGDKIISGVSSSIKQILGKKDIIFRYGGEEFVIINYCDDNKNISELCENIRRTVEMIEWEIDIKVTISIGACSSKDCGSKVLEYADQCLYESKNTGKNKYTIR